MPARHPASVKGGHVGLPMQMPLFEGIDEASNYLDANRWGFFSLLVKDTDFFKSQTQSNNTFAQSLVKA